MLVTTIANARNSALAEERVIICYLVTFHDIKVLTRKVQKIVVDHLSYVSPAQSTSQKDVRVNGLGIIEMS